MRFRHFISDLAPLLGWMAVIFYLSTQAGGASRTDLFIDQFLGRWFPDWNRHLPWEVRDAIHYYVRKTAHVTEYAILGGLAVRVLHGRRGLSFPSLWLTAWIFASIYAGTDEYHQRFVSGRTPKVTDVLLDSAGAALGTLAATALVKKRKNRTTDA